MIQLRLVGQVTHFATISWPLIPAQKGDIILFDGEYYEIKHILHILHKVREDNISSSSLTFIVNQFPLI